MEIKKTSLYEEHVKSGATMVEFASFLMPIQYKGISEEHMAVRHHVGMFDVSHMGEIMISGVDATPFLEHVFTNRITDAKSSSCTYGLMCYPDGGVVDDLIVYKYSNEKYLLVVNASNTDNDFVWLLSEKTGYQCKIEDQSKHYSQIALQGPNARHIFEQIIGKKLDLPFYTFTEETLMNERIIVSATGYTGEDGYEIYGSHTLILKLWQLLRDTYQVPLCGLGCRDTLRFESNMPLYGHEIDRTITPLEAGLGFAVKLEKDFVGKTALLEQQTTGLKRKVVGLELLDKGIIRNPYKVYYNQEEVGYVTTGYLSPSLNLALGLALVKSEASKLGTIVEVEVRNKRLKAVVRNKKFYQKKNKQ